MQTSYLYAVTDDGTRHKIGHTKDLRQRLSTFQTGQAGKLQLSAAISVPQCRARALEAHIHRDIAWRRIRGEWFEMTPEEAWSLLEFARIRWLEDPSIGPSAPDDWVETDPLEVLDAPGFPCTL